MNQTELLKSMKLFLFDMDGTLYLGDRLYSFTTELQVRIKTFTGFTAQIIQHEADHCDGVLI